MPNLWVPDRASLHMTCTSKALCKCHVQARRSVATDLLAHDIPNYLTSFFKKREKKKERKKATGVMQEKQSMTTRI
jgi:hypothetical protein